MLQFQLIVAIVLATVVLCSAALFFWLSPPNRTGKIVLPTAIEDDAFQQQLSDDTDPFLVTKPEDFVDGTPVNEDRFWARVGYTNHPSSQFYFSNLFLFLPGKDKKTGAFWGSLVSCRRRYRCFRILNCYRSTTRNHHFLRDPYRFRYLPGSSCFTYSTRCRRSTSLGQHCSSVFFDCPFFLHFGY